MIIFNLKSVIVAIVSIGVFFGFVSIGRDGLGFALGGIAGLLISLLITDNKNFYKSSPKIFFIPTHFYCFLIFLFGALSFSREETKQKYINIETEKIKNNEIKEHIDFLIEDQELLFQNKYSADRTICKKIDSFLLLNLDTNYYPSEFNYLVRKRENKILILVNTKKTPLIDDEYKVGVYQTIEELFKIEEFFKSKTKYMGLYENDQFHEAVKVDSLDKSNSIYSIDRLSEFYKK